MSLEAALRTALGMLAAEPELARLLTVDAYPGEGEAALEARDEWIVRFGALLRAAAASDPQVAVSDAAFLAAFLIAGVRFQIGLVVLAGEGSDLLRLLPGTLEVLLVYFFEPGEARRLAQAALAGR